MAEGKKSFIIYTDSKGLVNKLDDVTAGKLFKMLFSYTCDEDPTTEDMVLDIAFEHFKQKLKLDLKKWEKTKEGRSKAGKASAEARKQKATNPTNVDFVQQSSTNPTVSVNVNVNDNVINNKGKFDDYILEISKQKQWSETFYMQFRVSNGSLKKLLETFKISLGLKEIKDQPKNISQFKTHFVNWCNIQDRLGKLNEYKKNKSKLKGAL